MTYLVEKDLEANVIAALKTRLDATEDLPAYRIDGVWQPTNTGVVKGLEESSEPVILGVAVSSPSFAEWTLPTADLTVALAVTVRRECAPTGEALAAIMEPVAALLLALQVDASHEIHDLLSTSTFTADGVRLDAAEPPAYSRDADAWRVTRSFIVRGRINS